jgi:hypothetical protein
MDRKPKNYTFVHANARTIETSNFSKEPINSMIAIVSTLYFITAVLYVL